jgi:hypothetical protein
MCSCLIFERLAMHNLDGDDYRCALVIARRAVLRITPEMGKKVWSAHQFRESLHSNEVQRMGEE